MLQLRVTNGFPTRFLVPTLQQELPYRQPHRVQRLRHHKLKEPFRDVLIYLVDRECDTLGCRDACEVQGFRFGDCCLGILRNSVIVAL